ncbi:protein-glutamate O-methyltransferase CheR [Dyadobacter sp. NIV53]|uniref:CheR family methyltransferase n=1 Tax=Dyadobacter sp. NIV53 TaxID=2861765 RepID=UPI001C86E1DE|nr:CheR family methyltransferase [Dyadobacter sp. NIV53]
METIDYRGLESLIFRLRETSGFDFSGYTRPSLMRRARLHLVKRAVSLSELMTDIHRNEVAAYDLVQDLTVNYSEMFRDPDFFALLKSEVLSYFESCATFRIWVAGCASGEEAFSLSILLRESGLIDKSIIYATDLNKKILASAREGVFSLARARNFSENYLKAGGNYSLSDYYQVSYGKAIMHHELRKKIIFSHHDLVGDGVFNEFQLICCRNVMIYFTLEQRKKVLELLYESLSMYGYLCLGKRESLSYSGLEEKFRIISIPLNIYQKIL